MSTDRRLSADGRVILSEEPACFHVSWDCSIVEGMMNPTVVSRQEVDDSLELCWFCRTLREGRQTELSVDGRVIPGGSKTRRFHIFWDCPSVDALKNPVEKDRSVLFDDMELCLKCRRRAEESR